MFRWYMVLFVMLSTLTSTRSKFQTDYSYLGDVVILCAMGRSGSGFLLRVVQNIAGDCGKGDGSRCIRGELFERSDENMTDPKGHVIEVLDHLRKSYGHKPIIGSKWKPYTDNKRFDIAWQWVADQDFPVILSTRNPLDVYISRRKSEESDLSAHCSPGDDKCIQKHLSIKVYVDPKTAMESIDADNLLFHNLRKKFLNMRVRYFELSYEAITFGTDEEKIDLLQAMADFFIPRTRKRHKASLKDLTTDVVQTTTYNQSDVVLNYDELFAKLSRSGSQYAALLHP